MTEHNDDLGRSLTERLRAYENRIAAEPAPDLDAMGQGARRPSARAWGTLAAVGGVVVGLVLALSLKNLVPPPTGEASSTPQPTSSAAATPRASGTSVPRETPAPAIPTIGGLQWTQAGSFGAEGSREEVSALTERDGLIVAVGTHYDDEARPVFGPPSAHEGRVWISNNGRAWGDVTPSGTFDNVALRQVYTTPNGSFIAIGLRTEWPDQVSLAWESSDGRSWDQTSTGLPAGATVLDVERGPIGYLALSRTEDAYKGAHQLWLSSNGRTWDLVRDAHEKETLYDIGAGLEGFVAVGRRLLEHPAEAVFSLASADGREWFEGPLYSAPTNVTPIRGDWVTMGLIAGDPGALPLWRSANGLDWTASGSVTAESVLLTDGATCQEYLGRLDNADRWLVLNLTLSFPCSEGGFVTPGRQLVSVDGATWDELPFTQYSSVADVLATKGLLLLVGHTAERASFWTGEAP